MRRKCLLVRMYLAIASAEILLHLVVLNSRSTALVFSGEHQRVFPVHVENLERLAM
jgi:hypothetical protein